MVGQTNKHIYHLVDIIEIEVDSNVASTVAKYDKITICMGAVSGRIVVESLSITQMAIINNMSNVFGEVSDMSDSEIYKYNYSGEASGLSDKQKSN